MSAETVQGMMPRRCMCLFPFRCWFPRSTLCRQVQGCRVWCVSRSPPGFFFVLRFPSMQCCSPTFDIRVQDPSVYIVNGGGGSLVFGCVTAWSERGWVTNTRKQSFREVRVVTVGLNITSSPLLMFALAFFSSRWWVSVRLSA